MPRVTLRNRLDVAGELVGHGYTVTHYVAPWASVSGATSDMNDMGAAAWTAASSPSTPTTIRTALIRAVGGNITELAPGVYEDGVNGRGATDPIWNPVTAGTLGSLNLFTAKYPAAYNSNAANYTQFKRTSDPAVGGTSCPIWGYRSYTVLDGVYFAYGQGANPHSRGIVYYGYDTTGMEVRRLLFDRTNLGFADDGDNYNCIHCHRVLDAKVLDCHFRNGYDPTGSHNEACITTYGAENITIRNCWFDNVMTGIYWKGTDGAGAGMQGNPGLCELNFFDRNRSAMECATNHNTETALCEIKQNLFVEVATGNGAEQGFSFDSATVAQRYFSIHHNTFIGQASDDGGLIVIEVGIDGTGCVFRDNIVAYFLTTAQPVVNAQQALTNFDTWNYNRYYENGNTPQYFVGSMRTGIVDWRAASSRDANSTEGDPSFVNQAAGNYRLAGGSPCLTLSSTSGPVGCYITGSEEIGLRAAPSY